MKHLLLSLLALSTINPLLSMEPREKIKPYLVVRLDEHFTSLGVPEELNLIDPHEQISDELLLELNPRWQILKERFNASAKDSIIAMAYGYAFRYAYLSDYSIARNIIALAVCIGADPNYSVEHEHPILFATRQQDYWFTYYLLEKGANVKFDTKTWSYVNPVANAESLELAELVLRYGAEIPETILDTCCRKKYQPKLLQLYLAKGQNLKLENHTKDHESSLWHSLMGYGIDSQEQIEKARILLNIGLNLSFQNYAGSTGLHIAARLNLNNMIALVANHHLDRHRELVIVLGCIKKKHPDFYKYKDTRQFCFKELSPMRKLRALLSIKCNTGETAYGAKPIEELNPETCTFSNLMKLRNAAQLKLTPEPNSEGTNKC